MAATTNAIREGLLSLSNRETGGFRSAAEAAREMMQEVRFLDKIVRLITTKTLLLWCRTEHLTPNIDCLAVIQFCPLLYRTLFRSWPQA